MAEEQVLYLNADNVYGSDELGLPYRDIMGEGVVESGDFAVTQRAAGANMSVDVAAGACWIKGDDDADLQPTYRYREPAVTNVAVTAADPTDPRIDRVVAEVLDDTFSGVSKLGRIRVVAGTPTTGATLTNLSGAAAVPDNALLLANLLVPAGGTAVDDAEIDDVRPRALVGGGVARVSGIVLIEDQLLTVDAADFDFTDIPQDFTSLRLLVRGRGAATGGASSLQVQFNGDTGNNYYYNGILITASVATLAASATSAVRVGRVPAGGDTDFSQSVIEIPYYSDDGNVGTTHARCVSPEGSPPTVETVDGVWQDTDAINRIRVINSGGDFEAGSRATLYGIR